MVKKSQIRPTKVESNTERKSSKFVEQGTQTLMDIYHFSNAVASDIVNGSMDRGDATAVAANIRGSLKAAELILKYGPKRPDHELLGKPGA